MQGMELSNGCRASERPFKIETFEYVKMRSVRSVGLLDVKKTLSPLSKIESYSNKASNSDINRPPFLASLW